MAMDLDPDVVAVSSQPFWLRWRDGPGAGTPTTGTTLTCCPGADGTLRSSAPGRLGRITYGELSRRLDVGQVSSTAISYMGFATKTQR